MLFDDRNRSRIAGERDLRPALGRCDQREKTTMDNKNKAHDSNPDPITGEPGAHPLGVAGGASGGAVAGAALGAIGGPVGAAVGGAIGAVAGGLAGKGAAESVNPTEEDAYWREHHTSRPYFKSGRTYDDYSPAYRYGWESASRPEYMGRRFEDVESDLGRGWDKFRGKAKSEWSEMKAATRDAFDRTQNRVSPGMTRASETNINTNPTTDRTGNTLADAEALRSR